MTPVAGELSVARAEGVGAGKFLATSLLDALQCASCSVDIRRSAHAPVQGDEGIDFMVCNDAEDSCEIIRVGIDRHGTVLSAELLRCPKEVPMAGFVDCEALLRELGGGQAVAALRWNRTAAMGGEVLSITMRHDRRISIDLNRHADA